MSPSRNDRAPLRGRGTHLNPRNRFEQLAVERDPEELSGPAPTEYFRDPSRSIIATNDSPDVGFDASVNPYRGCTHGCIYCYARPGHEYLGLSAGLDFETKIFVKEDAPKLLRATLSSPRWKPRTIALSGVTDCYQPVERRLGITRRCLEVLAEFRNPVVIVTKNHLVTRDADLLVELARVDAAAVLVSVTSLDQSLQKRLEPRASSPARRLDTIRELAAAGVPVGVLVAPIIPGLTDHETPAIVAAGAEAGASFAGRVVLRLPYGVRNLFERWLEDHVPDRKEKVLHRIGELRGGRLNDPRFGSRMRGEGLHAETLASLFHAACRKAGIAASHPELCTAAFRRVQASLF